MSKLNIQQFRNIREIDKQIIIDAGPYRIGKGIVPSILRFIIVNKDKVLFSANVSVFLESCSLV